MIEKNGGGRRAQVVSIFHLAFFHAILEVFHNKIDVFEIRIDKDFFP